MLQFDAYFKEAVDESPLENHRVRKCKILVYLVDSSVQIDEYRQENSGMPQGTLVKRHQIPYPEVRWWLVKASLNGCTRMKGCCARLHFAVSVVLLCSVNWIVYVVHHNIAQIVWS